MQISLTSLLLAGVSITNLANAYPHNPDTHIETRDETQAALEARAGLKLKVAKDPTASVTCPETNNPQRKHQDPHVYTTNQVKQAYIEGAKLAAAGKALGDKKYPHIFNNNEELPFPCGRNKMEFVIMPDGHVYNGEEATQLPDRVIFEYKKSSSEMQVSYCGVMRHGPNNKFLLCP
ncbi:Ribonuclease/ribotoxin [Xylariomycetidae sp. FL2044]|nr:Ribonuclease/ribotoxin [Xylariomycetidae sp. FL2044]